MDREQYLAYMREYNRMYKASKRSNICHEFMLIGSEHLKVEPTFLNFDGTDELEPIVCSEFGCRKHLSLEEQRFGTVCIHCQNKKKIDVAKYVSHSIKKTA